MHFRERKKQCEEHNCIIHLQTGDFCKVQRHDDRGRDNPCDARHCPAHRYCKTHDVRDDDYVLEQTGLMKDYQEEMG